MTDSVTLHPSPVLAGRCMGSRLYPPFLQIVRALSRYFASAQCVRNTSLSVSKSDSGAFEIKSIIA
jgi:hypothetical protein